MKVNIIHAEDIFGMNFGWLQGKTTRKKTSWLVMTTDDLPTGMLKHHRNVTLEADIMNVNEVPFVVTIFWRIHLSAAELIKRKRSDISHVDQKSTTNISQAGQSCPKLSNVELFALQN